MPIDMENIFKAQAKSTWSFLIENGQGCYIPAYQRQYSWNKENVVRLFEDAVHGMNMLLNREDIRSSCPGMRRCSDFHRCFNCEGSPCSGWVKKRELAEGIGRSRGGRTSKVHAAVDAKGRPFRLEISGGQLHDSQMMEALP